jgi:urease accessory protein
MKRVTQILKHGSEKAADHVVLDYDYRHRRRIALTSAKGTAFLLDLAQVPDLRGNDVLVLDSGEMIVVEAAPEELMEISCDDPLHLARVAWHLGNRHLPTEIAPGVLRIRADHVIGEMAQGLGAKVTTIRAPFDPEKGAYAAQSAATSQHSHSHGHDHGHGHHHHHGNTAHSHD